MCAVGKPEQNDNNDFHLKFNIVMVYSAVKSIGKTIEFFFLYQVYHIEPYSLIWVFEMLHVNDWLQSQVQKIMWTSIWKLITLNISAILFIRFKPSVVH